MCKTIFFGFKKNVKVYSDWLTDWQKIIRKQISHRNILKYKREFYNLYFEWYEATKKTLCVWECEWVSKWQTEKNEWINCLELQISVPFRWLFISLDKAPWTQIIMKSLTPKKLIDE